MVPKKAIKLYAIINDNADVIERYDYTLYGTQSIFNQNKTQQRTKSIINNTYGFTGRRLDQESGLYYFRVRYFDAELGRFISRDSIGYKDGMNIYRGYFVPGGMDPSGMAWYDEIVENVQSGINSAKNCLSGLANSLDGLGSNDSYSHCVVSCRISSSCGQTAAYTLGLIKELRDFGVGFVIDWGDDWDETWGDIIDDLEVDLFGGAVCTNDCNTCCECAYGGPDGS